MLERPNRDLSDSRGSLYQELQFLRGGTWSGLFA
jgi:hypothetical protein